MEMIAYEGFIRRASEVNFPFMLKGSYVTRQYFANPTDRLPNDLDWVYLHTLTNVEDARKTFDEWVIQVTETYEKDGIRFQSFKENAFWRMIDYAMADDFPTINTDLKCWVDEEEFDWFALDISFNLEVEAPPIPLLYQPLRGEPFTIPQTVPLSLQVAWKLHQTLVRPRFKDIFDLTHLLQHPDFNAKALEQTLKALTNECKADNVDVHSIQYMIDGNLQPLFKDVDSNAMWDFWRFGKSKNGLTYLQVYEKAEHITDAEKLPSHLSEFIEQFQSALSKAGLSQETVKKLPSTNKKNLHNLFIPEAEKPNIEEQAQTKQSVIRSFLNRLFK